MEPVCKVLVTCCRHLIGMTQISNWHERLENDLETSLKLVTTNMFHKLHTLLNTPLGIKGGQPLHSTSFIISLSPWEKALLVS